LVRSLLAGGPALDRALGALLDALGGRLVLLAGEVQVLDLRSLSPLDREAVLAVARHCHRVLIVHEDTRTGGFGAEIAATVAEEAFEDLDAPVKRIAAPDTPVPFSPPLEKAFIPQVDDVTAGLRELAEY